ncbi:DUF4157 domain-containing protein [Scytonema sp. NUACC26]|uniref:eCIS core domain-containing protein n=1 Tax=Scytonema sp. NUACC26 TaxID=3140176 RepID=UPI0034DC5ADB
MREKIQRKTSSGSSTPEYQFAPRTFGNERSQVQRSQLDQRPFASVERQSQQNVPLTPEIGEKTQFPGHELAKISLFHPSRMSSQPIQTKLTVGAPGDKYEQEADKMAIQVMSIPDSAVQQKMTIEEPEEEVQTKPLADGITPLVQRETISEEEKDLQTKRSLQRTTNGSFLGGNNLESRLNGSAGGGSPLPDDVRSFMEPRFGADFSQVRVYTGSEAIQMNQDLNAQAFTHGSDIYFGAGKTPANDELTAHELTHVVQQAHSTRKQQTDLTANFLSGVVERESNTLASQVIAGQKLQVLQSAPVGLYGGWITDIRNVIGDALNNRPGEAELDAWEDYQDALKESGKFIAKTYASKNFQPTTGLGMFDAIYTPGSDRTLQIICKCKFNFVNGSVRDFPKAYKGELTWNDRSEKDDWKTKFIQTASSTWSSGNHVFYCQKDWWENIIAKVSVKFTVVDEGEHFVLDVSKTQSRLDKSPVSKVKRPEKGVFFGYSAGSAKLDSRDLEQTRKSGGTQIPAAHEAGHMLGLDDEYYDTQKPSEPKHSNLVQSEFGHGVARGSDGRIMSGGMDIKPEHGVTFLEALKEATAMPEWSMSPKVPKPVPPFPINLPS